MRCRSSEDSPLLSWIEFIMEKNKSHWFPFPTLNNIITYPFEYSKVLMQIGHEPIAPRLTKNLLGKPRLALPNVFQYIRYINSVDGFTGCYRGFVPKLCAYTISHIAFEKTVESIKFDEEPDTSVPIDDLEDDKRDKVYVQEFFKYLFGKIVGIILSHPLDVISVRMMAQFVGRETKYVTLVGSIAEIYRINGLSGFFAGIAPRIFLNVITLVIVTTSTYVINKYLVKDKELRTLTSSAAAFFSAAITYPFQSVSVCMIVNNCSLAAGEPPLMPIYTHWTDCWAHLSSMRQLDRGKNILWRYYTGPQIIIDGRPVADTSYNFRKIQ